MYEPKLWQDHVTEYENRYTESRNEDGTITHTAIEGEIIQQGTPQNAFNFNHMEEGISNASELSALLTITTIHQKQAVDNLRGETIEITLTNTQEYPFNNSEETVALEIERNNMDYAVESEVKNCEGGFCGEIIVSNKLLNGFKIAYSGSAKSVTLKIHIKGGFC